MDEIARALAESCATGRPLVVMNAPFDLTLLDRELKRHRASSLAGYLDGVPMRVVDPRVLDKHLDRYRKGRHVMVAVRVTRWCSTEPTTRRPTRRLRWSWCGRCACASTRLERPSPSELHTLQVTWHVAQGRGLEVLREWNAGEGGSGVAAAPGTACGRLRDRGVGQVGRLRDVGGPAFPGWAILGSNQ